ncbi:unnamed protein product [Acanthoscelides obtectus]|uniref:Transposase n=1 Tax=Acanthoscelides obtectus TaxID=200917 RepID=A0A9P0KB13_ACAOB|nr:unnamed protein product [Acanthoscelides obtectus]CAK1657688.1 Mariner Mos1 transposase [Acanthoscelides obtectus]
MVSTAEIFNERHENSNVHRKYVLELVVKFRETGSVANKKRNIENPIRNEAIEVGDLGQVYVDPTLSTRKLETVCGVSRRTVQRILKIHINRHNCRYWSNSNPRIYHDINTQQPQKLNNALLTPHQSTISRWYREFKRGRVSLSDDPRVELGVRKLVSRWIPHLLTEEQKAARVNWCQKTLDRFNSAISKNVYSIVSGDESWISCYEPENKRQSAIWVFQGEEKPTKVIRSRSVSKKMVATFVSKSGRIVTADWYTTICLPKVITELRKINPERRIILHQDDGSSHTAQKTRQYLTEENVELLDHPPYKEAVDALKYAVLDLPANEWNKCFENWFERMQMCINLRGEYF